LKISANAQKILEKRYLTKDSNGIITESPVGLFKRVSSAIAGVDVLYDDVPIAKAEKEFFQAMSNFEFLPNSPTLMNAGTPVNQLSACFVLPVGDSMEEIFDALKYMALIHKSGGGTGFSFSNLRPRKDIVRSTAGIASGPVSFMKIFDVATDVVKQGGRRRGANMGILKVTHPDILEFINAKEKEGFLSNFNLSVSVDDEFMQKVEAADESTALESSVFGGGDVTADGRIKDIESKCTVDEASRDRDNRNNETKGKNCTVSHRIKDLNTEYALINPRNNKVAGKVDAVKVFDRVVEMAWRMGDPGIIFMDEVNKNNPTPLAGKIKATNPCGEQPLLPYESCNLGSINLAKMVKNGGVNWSKLEKTIKTAVHFLDNVIDANTFPVPQIKVETLKNRKIGLGVMGFADMLIMLGVPYSSQQAVKIAEKVMEFIEKNSREFSAELGRLRGSFPNFRGSVWDVKGYDAMRNATTTTIAPTGTLSIIANVASGIEPLFAVSFIRRLTGGMKLLEVNSLFEKLAKDGGFYSEKLMMSIAQKGSIQDIPDIPEDVKRLFLTAHDIKPAWHVRMQAAFQRHVDNAVAKTVNLSPDASIQDVKKIFLLAYKLKCKGVTVYRYGSKKKQVLYIKDLGAGTNYLCAGLEYAGGCLRIPCPH
jgi:ribonucleoside-diphosphate reductase alpha chain